LTGGRKFATWKPWKFSLNGALFFREMVLENGRFHIWVYFYGSKEDAKNYHCQIKVYGADNEELSYNGTPRSLDESKEEVLNEECGLILSLAQVKRMVSEENLKYSVKITCPKDEARDEDVESGISDNDENTTSNHSTKKRKVSP
jgi:hypothetical protein